MTQAPSSSIDRTRVTILAAAIRAGSRCLTIRSEIDDWLPLATMSTVRVVPISRRTTAKPPSSFVRTEDRTFRNARTGSCRLSFIYCSQGAAQEGHKIRVRGAEHTPRGETLVAGDGPGTVSPTEARMTALFRRAWVRPSHSVDDRTRAPDPHSRRPLRCGR